MGETLPRSWHGGLSETNIEMVAAMIRERLEGRYFSIASASVVNRPDPRLELRTGCRFEPNWTDGSKEPVRVMPIQPADWSKEPPARWLAFSAGHYFWMFFPRDGEGTRFSFDYDGFEVEFSAPCGDRHKHYFRAEPAERDCPRCEGWHDLSLPCAPTPSAEAASFGERPVVGITEPEQVECGRCSRFHSPELPCVTPADEAWKMFGEGVQT